ncbi:cytochrome C oxidase assembly protein CtaG domain protein [Teladorsagia circumcincta]|uniref:Cytochrome c oxidase assembly protein COX11, mitochondrial n=1 Tax=Teladorsagia circumcincta TaxID=45464 RepID=A0A2G9U6R2_TELCI|nr:cytochrome C oxidase assembly protein CtaG domain protein [Teladorsagia circumcincta]
MVALRRMESQIPNIKEVADDFEKIARMKKVEDRLIRVQFNSDTPSSMQWEFKPQQHEMYVHPGETALAFYTAKNPTDRPIVGISSYNLTPFQAAYYFNKIQCFCFEEQILNPGEQVDLPVFFYIDPDYANDPALEYLDNILLSYTFFEAKSGLQLPSPFDPNNRPNVGTARVEPKTVYELTEDHYKHELFMSEKPEKSAKKTRVQNKIANTSPTHNSIEG